MDASIPSRRERTQPFSVSGLLQPCHVACCDFTSSDDDEHNTDSNFLFLFADVDITPTLLEGLTEVDVLHIALGCRFALDILTISHLCANTLRSLLLHLSLVLAFVYLCSLMEGQQNVQLPPGTTVWNHSHYTGNSFSAPHSVQQLQNGTISTSVQPLD